MTSAPAHKLIVVESHIHPDVVRAAVAFGWHVTVCRSFRDLRVSRIRHAIVLVGNNLPDATLADVRWWASKRPGMATFVVSSRSVTCLATNCELSLTALHLSVIAAAIAGSRTQAAIAGVVGADAYEVIRARVEIRERFGTATFEDAVQRASELGLVAETGGAR